MIDNTCNFLGVAFEYSHDLLCVFVEDDSILVVTTGHNLGRVLKANIQGQDTRNTRAVESLTATWGHIYKYEYKICSNIIFTGKSKW